MSFEVITTGQFMLGLGISLVFFTLAFLVGKFVKMGSPEASMVPNVLHGMIVGLLAIFGIVTLGMTMGFGYANPDHYQEQVQSPEEAGYPGIGDEADDQEADDQEE